MTRHTFYTGRLIHTPRGFDESGNRPIGWEGDWEYTYLDDPDQVGASMDAKRAEDTETGERIMTYIDKIPKPVLRGLTNYVNHGLPPGDFLTAVLENNLGNAVVYADPDSLDALLPIVRLLHWEAPPECWRHPDRVTAWKAMDREDRAEIVESCPTWQRFMEEVTNPDPVTVF